MLLARRRNFRCCSNLMLVMVLGICVDSSEGTLESGQNQTILETLNGEIDRNDSKICNETYLSTHYGKAVGVKNKEVILESVNKRCTTHYPKCVKKTPSFHLAAHLAVFNKNSDLIMTFDIDGLGKDCMTYFIEGTFYRHGVVQNYFMFFKHKPNISIRADFNSSCRFTLHELPSSAKISTSLVLPSVCAVALMDYGETVFRAIRKTHTCHIYEKEEQRVNRELNHEYDTACQAGGYIEEKAKKWFDQKIREKYCYARNQSIVVSNQNTLIAAILSVAIFILVCLMIVYFLKSKRKCPTMFGKRSDDFRNDQHVSIMRSVSDDSETSSRGEPPTVMILNRPGCELLDTLLRDVAFILQSYGIQVRLSLLEQSELDAEGGISSYLQRNIDTCDYILIMFTEYSEEHPISQHKPYEFALNVISGLMFHTNDSSRYLAMYTSSFQEAMHYMPTIFHASQDYGYRIPNDVPRLVEKLLGRKIDEQQKERELKNKLFLDRMKFSKKKLDSKVHEKCQRTKCHKGTVFPSISNLSSIWATTIHSGKWPSFNSIHSLENVLRTENDSNELLHVELWTHNNLANVTVADDANQNRIVSL